MSDIASYVLAGILRSIGKPSKSGFLGRKLVVEATVVDGAFEQMLLIAIGLGTGRPFLAVRLIGDLFQDREWTAQSAAELVDFLDAD